MNSNYFDEILLSHQFNDDEAQNFNDPVNDNEAQNFKDPQNDDEAQNFKDSQKKQYFEILNQLENNEPVIFQKIEYNCDS